MVLGPQIFVESQFMLGFVLGVGDQGITEQIMLILFAKLKGPAWQIDT